MIETSTPSNRQADRQAQMSYSMLDDGVQDWKMQLIVL